MSINRGGRNAILGFEYQILYGLYLLMKSDENIVEYVEHYDDLSIENNGVTESFQVKTTQTPKIINDNSLEFWNSLRNWSYNIQQNNLALSNSYFVLITMNQVAPNTILYMLKPEIGNYNEAYTKIHELGSKSGNKIIRENYYPVFKKLERKSQLDLLQRISVLDNSPSMSDIQQKIKNLIRGFTDDEFVDQFYSDLYGWWHNTLNEQLESDTHAPISWYDLNMKKKYFRNKYNKQILLQTITIKDVLNSVLPSNESIFMKQLEKIGITDEQTLIDAKLDYQTTKQQNDLWVEEDEGNDDIIQKYRVNTVKRNYQHKFNFEKNNIDSKSETNMKKQWGQNMYRWAMYDTDWKISESADESYKRGVLHELADVPEIGWHPFYEDELK